MLKTVSSITNAIGALNYKGTWNASTNTPTITSSVGVKGDYYVVSVGGSTAIDGISNWGVGDWITFNGSVWQRVEGGADLNGVNLSVSGTTNLSALTASTALALDASKNVVSVTNTGTGNNVLASSPTLTTPTATALRQQTTSGCIANLSGTFGKIAANGNTKTLTITYDTAAGTAEEATVIVDASFTGFFNNWNAGGLKRIVTSSGITTAKTGLSATQDTDLIAAGGIGGAGVVTRTGITSSTTAVTLTYTFNASSANTSLVNFDVRASVQFSSTSDKRNFTLSWS